MFHFRLYHYEAGNRLEGFKSAHIRYAVVLLGKHLLQVCDDSVGGSEGRTDSIFRTPSSALLTGGGRRQLTLTPQQPVPVKRSAAQSAPPQWNPTLLFPTKLLPEPEGYEYAL